jgi:hypothetical protein
MGRIGRLVIVGLMAGEASVRGGIVIACMAGGTVIGNGDMGPFQHIIGIVYRERSGRPAGICSMAFLASVGYGQRQVIWIGTLDEVSVMAVSANGRSA